MDEISKVTSQAMEVFNTFQIDGMYSEEGVSTNVSVWYENKQNLMNIFRKHPNWNEEAKAIVYTRDEIRPKDFAMGYNKYYTLYHYVNNNIGMSSRYRGFASRLARLVCDYQSETLTAAMIDYIKSDYVPEFIIPSLKEGAKLTRIINKAYTKVETKDDIICDATTLEDAHEDGNRNFNSYQKYFAKFADCLSELKIKKITLLSVNFNDFMTMSNGNSWSSCHFINSHGIFHDDAETSYHGMYKQGCLSYALDDCSFIFYTLPDTYNGTEYYMQPKLNRMCCQYKDGILITGKLYPNNEDALITQYRQIMQTIISECEGFANSWTFSKRIDRIAEFTQTAYNSGHYADYTYDNQKPTVSLHKPFMIEDLENFPKLTIGHEAYCLKCGRTLYGGDHEWLQCDSHQNVRRCCNCGCVLEDDDDYYEIDGEIYCYRCTFYCDYHEQREPYYEDAVYSLSTRDGEINVCEDAYDNYAECEECGYYELTDNMHETENGYICDECYQDKQKYCPICGTEIDNDEQYCEDCHKYEKMISLQNDYDVGDYVLIYGYIPENVHYGASQSMRRCYSGRIVQINNINGRLYSVTQLDGAIWMWATDCFAGKIINGNDDMIGKTMKEVFGND